MAATDITDGETAAIEAATARLVHALDALEAAAERRREADREGRSLVEHVHALGSDRARLASELDEATARSKQLETANREVATRIDRAIESIRGALNSDE